MNKINCRLPRSKQAKKKKEHVNFISSSVNVTSRESQKMPFMPTNCILSVVILTTYQQVKTFRNMSKALIQMLTD